MRRIPLPFSQLWHVESLSHSRLYHPSPQFRHPIWRDSTSGIRNYAELSKFKMLLYSVASRLIHQFTTRNVIK